MRRREFLSAPAVLPAAAQAVIEQTEAIEIVSSLEHLLSGRERYALKPDVSTLLSHDAAGDLCRAGLAGEWKRRENSEPRWGHVRGTGSGQAAWIGLQVISGIEEPGAESVPALADRIPGSGGDSQYAGLAHAHARMARGWCTEREALEKTGRLLSAENAARLSARRRG